MDRAYKIADVAQRSGFSAATLRYYEDVGLLAPSARTGAGYRLYDDASLERLRFIARAKQLGCSLAEIRDLATVWAGGECGPVQDRLRASVEAKVTETRGRIAELTLFAADLQRAAAALGVHRPEGPCDDACGCVGDRPTGSPPIACALGADQMSARLDEWTALLAEEPELLRGVTGRLPLEDGVRLEFGPGTDVSELARLAVAEQSCCRFFSFAIVVDSRGIALEVHAPPEASDVVAALFGAAG